MSRRVCVSSLFCFLLPLLIEGWVTLPLKSCPSTTRVWAGKQSNSKEPSSSDNSKKKKTTKRPTKTDSSDSSMERKIEKKIKVAEKQSEIDRILSGPDAPFDMEQELKKVTSMAPPIPENDPALDATISALEQDLYQAVKQQDYATAAAVKTQIDQHHVDDCGAVLQVNAAFYRAFSHKHYDSMQDIWIQDNTATCIHPSSKPLVGAKNVLNSWKRMFQSANGSFQRNWMEPHNIKLSVQGASTAIVTCDEQVYARRFVRGQKRQTELINHLTATNVFRKVGGKWFLCYHHASWHADSEAAKQALQTPLQKKQVVRRQRDSDGEISMDGIMGMENFGPLLGDESKDDASTGGKKGPVKRIVMGSLSDILEGGLGDLLSGSNDNENGQADNIIQFRNLDDASLDGMDDEDDDEDDDDDDLDDDEEEEGTVAIIKQWAESSDGSSSSNNSSSSTPSSAKNDNSAPKDALRQECISALRRLCQQGTISPKQKRVLLTDIISCSARGDFSMVEVAYELLCGEGDDKDAAEEEFADQCRVFAQSLPETLPGPSSP